jgi:hypothetical protein
VSVCSLLYVCVCTCVSVHGFQDEWFFSGTTAGKILELPPLKAIVFSEDSDTSLVWCVYMEWELRLSGVQKRASFT